MPISPLSLEDLALRSVVVEGLYDPELPNSIQIELEKLWMLPGRYRIYHVERKVEREDKEPMTNVQWNAAMDLSMRIMSEDCYGKYITIYEEPGAAWSMEAPHRNWDVEAGYKLHPKGMLVDTFFKNGGVKERMFRLGGSKGIEWGGSMEWRLTDGGDLVHVGKGRITEEAGKPDKPDLLITRTFLARRVDL